MGTRTTILIPARNEEKNIGATIQSIADTFRQAGKDFEILVVDDGSQDGTGRIVDEIHAAHPHISVIRNEGCHGIGNAIRFGLGHFTGDWVIIAMADASDDPANMLDYVREMEQGADCCFGSRWCRGARVVHYPVHKLLLNRIVNKCIEVLFGMRYNDTTNAFKCYSRQAIKGVQPVISHHFNITVELPLKAIVRGFSYTVVPTHWYNRTHGISSLKIHEMGSRYLFIILYIWLEKYFSRGDYRRI